MDKVNKIRKRDVNIEKSIEDDIVETLVRNAEEVARISKEKDKYNEFHKKVDKLLVSKVTGIPIMILLLLVVLWITITLANYPSQLLSTCLVILRFG